MGTYFVAVAWIFSIVKINSRLSYGNLLSQVKLHIKIWQDDLCSNMNITTIFKKGLFYSKIKYLWYDCQLSAFTLITGKSLSEALIFAASNPQYDIRLFIELRVQYMKTTSSEHVVYTNCFLFLYWQFKTIYVHNMFWDCSFHVLNS